MVTIFNKIKLTWHKIRLDILINELYGEKGFCADVNEVIQMKEEIASLKRKIKREQILCKQQKEYSRRNNGTRFKIRSKSNQSKKRH